MRASRWVVGALAGAMLMVGVPATTRADAPDAWITTKVKTTLLTTEGVSGTAINVDTVDGRVTLHGKVRSEDEKRKAESVAREVTGVKEVHDLLQVVPERREDSVKVSDKDLKAHVERALKDDPSLVKSAIAVQSVNNGVVLLAGKANTMTDHLRAIEDAAAVRGVHRVSSEIQSPDSLADEEIRRGEARKGPEGAAAGARETVSDMYVTSATKLRLMADGRAPATAINVDTNRGVVTLFGMVPTSEAKSAAQEDARKVSGVKQVRNELQIVPESKQQAIKARDEDVQKDVEKAIDARPGLGDAKIEVEVKNGVARLSGTVTNEHDRLAAAIAARSTNGVRSVQDDLKIAQ
jgi:hyperosmotically inducible protein